jgi:aspartyl/asparaginyl-tRNA synthetase
MRIYLHEKWKRVWSTYRNFSMMAPTIKNILKEPHLQGQQTTLEGWIKTLRRHKDHIFMEISDGSSLKGLQVVCNMSSSTDVSA